MWSVLVSKFLIVFETFGTLLEEIGSTFFKEIIVTRHCKPRLKKRKINESLVGDYSSATCDYFRL